MVVQHWKPALQLAPVGAQPPPLDPLEPEPPPEPEPEPEPDEDPPTGESFTTASRGASTGASTLASSPASGPPSTVASVPLSGGGSSTISSGLSIGLSTGPSTGLSVPLSTTGGSHIPPTHESPVAHACSHVPQFFGSLERFAQNALLDPQRVSPPGHASPPIAASVGPPDEVLLLVSAVVTSDEPSMPDDELSGGMETSSPLLEPPSCASGPPDPLEPQPGPVNMATRAVEIPSPAMRIHDLPNRLVIRHPAGKDAVETSSHLDDSRTGAGSATKRPRNPSIRDDL
jgi:hypothetical protein